MDEAAEILQRAIAARRSVYAHAENALPGVPWDADTVVDVQRLQSCGEELSAMADRLAMRLTSFAISTLRSRVPAALRLTQPRARRPSAWEPSYSSDSPPKSRPRTSLPCLQ